MNMITPHPDGCSDLYDEYLARREPDLALNPTEIDVINTGADDTQPCTKFGVNKRRK